MRPNHLLLIGCVPVLSLLWSCSIKSDLESSRPDFSIEEARSVFEQAISGAESKSSSNVSASHKSRLSPGEFVPVWEDAVYSKEDGVPSYSVPILSQYKLYSYFGPYSTHRISERRRVVRQELVVSKCPDCPQGKCEIRSTVKRPNLRQTEPFTGLIIYTDPLSNAINCIEPYYRGEKRDVLAPDTMDGKVDKSQLIRMGQLLSVYCIARKSNALTKSDGDEDENWDDENEDNPIEDWGNGYFFDYSTGKFYSDEDGDGEPDTLIYYPFDFGDDNPDDFWDNIDYDLLFSYVFDSPDYYVAGTEFVPKNSTKLAWDNIITSTFASSYSFTCSELFSALSFDAQCLGGNISQDVIYSQYVQMSGDSNVMYHGIDPVRIPLLINYYFTSSTLSSRADIRHSIDAGHIVLAVLREAWDILHFVTIIGYDTTTLRFIYVSADSGIAYEESQNGLPLTLPAYEIHQLKN